MRLDRRGLPEPLPFVGADSRPGLFDGEVPLGLRHAHGPVERQPEPVDDVTRFGKRRVDLDERRLGSRPGREPDLHVVHHPALVATPSFVLGFGSRPIGAEERRRRCAEVAPLRGLRR